MTPQELEDRTFCFARDVRKLVKEAGPKITKSDADQIVRSSGSVGANYIEANEAIGQKDFMMRLRICRKEAKETSFWFRILESTIPTSCSTELLRLQGEAEELRKIFNASIRTLERQSANR